MSLRYSLQTDDLTTFSRSAQNLFTFINFEGVSGPNSLEGILTSEFTPGIFYNTVNHPISPSRGKSLFANISIAGLGGNTRFIQPVIEAKYFKQVSRRGNVLAMRLLVSVLTGYGGKVPPPFRRSFMGGGKRHSRLPDFFGQPDGLDSRHGQRPGLERQRNTA